MKNPITSEVNGTLTCDAFPRGGGRYEVICSLVRGDKVTFASHGTYIDKETALSVAKDVTRLMRDRNPLHICPYCGAHIYSVGVPKFCPKCKKTWGGRNPLTKKEVEYGLRHIESLRKRAKEQEERGDKRQLAYVLNRRADEYRTALYTFAPKSMLKKIGEANPIRYVDGWQYGTTGKVYPAREGALLQMRAIHYARGKRNPKKAVMTIAGELRRRGLGKSLALKKAWSARYLPNPRYKTPVETIGNIIGGLGILAIPVITGLILWIQSKVKK